MTKEKENLSFKELFYSNKMTAQDFVSLVETLNMIAKSVIVSKGTIGAREFLTTLRTITNSSYFKNASKVVITPLITQANDTIAKSNNSLKKDTMKSDSDLFLLDSLDLI